jgi:tau tubulin kinase
MDVTVLLLLNQNKSRHFCCIEDYTNFADFSYVVMTCVGRSLRDLSRQRKGERFSIGTALGVGIQCLEGIEDLHRIGYLHRDVKPANCAIGRKEKGEERIVYILDFGLCRKYVGDHGVMRRPREKVGFRGTMPYASMAAHLGQELCRRDDVESWLYMMVRLTSGTLPWKNTNDNRQVTEMKHTHRTGEQLNRLFDGCPNQYIDIMRYTQGLEFYDDPDYNFIYKRMRDAFTTTNSTEFPYDWE